MCKGTCLPAAFLLLCHVLLRSNGEVDGDRRYYKAAVYEHVRYNGNPGDSARQIIQTNLRAYATAIETAANEGVDIIVTPEWALYPHNKSDRDSINRFVENVPDPLSREWNPCRQEELFQDRLILRRLSCLARDNKIFVVANMADVKPCAASGEEVCDAQGVENCRSVVKKCHPDGKTFFNTNVVFDRKGNLVARYHKTHLYFELNFDPDDVPKPSYFETDFGNFTTFICFDMVFWEAVEAVEKRGILNVAYPTWWYEHYPLSLAVQFQQSWAMINGVNLLAANAHLPGTGTLGSGIYSGNRGALAYIYNPNGKSRLLISDVPIGKDFGSEPDVPAGNEPKLYILEGGVATEVKYADEHLNTPEQCSIQILGEPQSLLHDFRCKEFNAKGHERKKLEEPSGSLEVCQNDLCCSLTYEADSMDEEFYLMAAFRLPNASSVETLGVCMKFCLLIGCNKGDSGQVCDSFPMHSKTTFRHVELRGEFSSKHVYPAVIESGMRLTPVEQWTHVVDADGKSTLVFNLPSGEDQPLSSVSLYERCYDKDFPIDTGDLLKKLN